MVFFPTTYLIIHKVFTKFEDLGFYRGKFTFKNRKNNVLTLVLQSTDMSCLFKQCRSRSVGFLTGSALFAIKYVHLYQQSGPSILIGWKLEMGMAS